jgi:hypothetical protein
VDKPILRKSKDSKKEPDKPILRKRKNYQPLRLCNNIIDDGYFTGIEKRCGRPVKPPNKFLCSICLRHTESVEQILGFEE